MTLPGFPDPSPRRTVRNRAPSRRVPDGDPDTPFDGADTDAGGPDRHDEHNRTASDRSARRRRAHERYDEGPRDRRSERADDADPDRRDRGSEQTASGRRTSRGPVDATQSFRRPADYPTEPHGYRDPRDRPPPSPLPEHRGQVSGPPRTAATAGTAAETQVVADAKGRRDRPVTVTRVAASRARDFSRVTVKRIGDAARSGGAHESGLTKVIWMNVVQTGGDAMIAVALANTIFFSAATSQQRGNVALYLGITMAPFAVIAPLIGPALDRLPHGRRVALAGTMLIRGVLAWIMAANFHNVGLYPAVFGFLVVSKAFNVLKGAVVPRVLPDSMTLVKANARLSIFGLAGSVALGGLGGAVIKITGSSTWALRLSVLVFIAAAILAVKLPPHVDSAEGEVPADVLRSGEDAAGHRKSRRALGIPVVTALRGESAIRGLSGFLTLFLAFLIQHEYHGWHAAVALGALAVGAGGGGFIGTASGARFKLGRPDMMVLVCVSVATAMCAIVALTYTIEIAVAGVLVAGVCNSLGKLSLDAIIQREVPDWLRASTFGRSETMLQLSWVFGGALGISLPTDGRIGFAVAAALLVAILVATVISSRRRRIGNEPGSGLSRVRDRFGRRDRGSSSTQVERAVAKTD